MLAFGGVVAVIVGGGVVIDGMVARPATAAALPTFDNCTQLRHWVDRAAAQQHAAVRMGDVGATGGQGGEAVPLAGRMSSGTGTTTSGAQAGAPAAAPNASTTTATDSAVGSSATGTNVQEAGVDEPDQVKTDGKRIVGITPGRGLWVAELSGNVPRVVGRMRFDGEPTSLLLAGNRALVLVSPQFAPGGPIAMDAPAVAEGPAPSSGSIRPYAGQSRLVVVDLTDVRALRVVASQDVTGTVLTARQIGAVAWVVSQSRPTVTGGGKRPGARLLPEQRVRNSHGGVVSQGAAMPCSSVRHPTVLSGAQMLMVQPVDLTAGAPFTTGRSAGVVADSGFVYASTKRLYVATSKWGSTATTQIHAFNIGDGKQAKYVGSGSVTGTLLSQWAMSEQDGFLRVASTTGPVVPPPGEGDVPSKAFMSESLVSVLAERGSRLVRVGLVGGLGRGERVWAVRWLGNLAAVVTFRQTDPLYLLDVSQPRAPRLLGSLSLTGYSSYLHPVGDGLLLGVGHEADQMGRVENAKATLFDVRNPAHPRVVSKLDLGMGWGDVEGDSHAFTYLPARHLALLPLIRGDGSVATSIAVSPSALSTAGQLVGGGQVKRFLPVGDSVVAFGFDRLLSVDPTSLEVLGVASVH
jgi:uncharacterized secreted protein with C-terminal beta-propeller domain